MHRVKHSYKDGFAGVLRPKNQKAINGSVMKYKVGQVVTVDIPVAFTGAKSGENLLVECKGYQFWINKSVVQNNAKVYGKAKIVSVENGFYKIELAGCTFDCKEQYMK